MGTRCGGEDSPATAALRLLGRSSAAGAAPGGRRALLVKPAGDACELACRYCFYRGVGPRGEGVPARMPEEVLVALFVQALRPGGSGTVEFAWQGGEPLLLGAAFYRRAFELQRRLRPRGVTVLNTLQTSGHLLDEELCQLFAEHRCLVGLSIDGPEPLHDAMRKTRRGAGSHASAVRAARLLARAGVPTNALIAVHSANQEHPEAVYGHVVDELGIRHLQILPVALRDGGDLRPLAVDAERYGAFLVGLLHAWRRRDVGTVFVQPIEAVAAALVGSEGATCAWTATCGLNPVIERNGDVYSCDHFVDAAHRLGNLLETPLAELVGGARQRAFGLAKRALLPEECQACAALDLCGGGCPKDRPAAGRGSTACRPSVLCAGYRRFFAAAVETLSGLGTASVPAIRSGAGDPISQEVS